MHEYIPGLMVLALLYTPGYFIGKYLIELGKDISKNCRWIYAGFVWAIFMGPLPVELLGPPIPFSIYGGFTSLESIRRIIPRRACWNTHCTRARLAWSMG